MAFDKSYEGRHARRYAMTLDFMEKHIAPSSRVLDLGPPNPLSQLMTDKGYEVTNTPDGIDLDVDYGVVEQSDHDVLTAFEIFEHMVAPFNLLRVAKAEKLIASVPLKLWFSSAYWNADDKLRCHYHEFEARQFDFLMDKAGWKVVDSQKWTMPAGVLGIRPLLRLIYPRHYIVACERK